MSQTVGKDRKIMILSFAAAGATIIAGILHLTMVQRSLSHDLGEGILFLVGGVVQVFWAVPVIKQWGRVWQVIGIAGTAVFVILYFSSRLHLLPEGNILGGGPPGDSHPGEFPRGNITESNVPRGDFPRGNIPGGRGIGLNGTALQIEMSQIIFIGLYAVQSMIISRRQKK